MKIMFLVRVFCAPRLLRQEQLSLCPPPFVTPLRRRYSFRFHWLVRPLVGERLVLTVVGRVTAGGQLLKLKPARINAH